MTEAGLVPERVAATLGIRALAEGSLLATLTKIVGHRQLLLNLDNCEHVVEACANLTEARLKTCPCVRVLATSREPLGIRGKQVRPVSPLSVADDASESTSGGPAGAANALSIVGTMRSLSGVVYRTQPSV